VKRGEVWWATVDERRPVLVLSMSAQDVRAIIVVAPADRLVDGVTEEVSLGAAEGLPNEGVVRVAFPRPDFIPCNWLVTVPRHSMIERVGVLSVEKLDEIESLLRRAGLDVD
jgi:mRNA interferase MazF